MTVSSKLPENISDSLGASLGKVVSFSGNMDPATQRSLKSAVDGLERSLKYYETVANKLLSTRSYTDQLDDVIKDRIPNNYADKAYKRLFWRTVYKTVPFLTEKKKTEDQINALSRLSLTSFLTAYKAIIAYTNAIIQRGNVSSVDSNDTDPDSDPDTFDPELDDTVSGLEREIKPSQGRDQHQRKTDQNIKTKLKRKEPVEKAEDPEAFREFTGRHENSIDACRAAVKRHDSDLQEVLRFSTERSFGLIQASSSRAAVLGQVLLTAANRAREDLEPGTYVACKGILASILSLNNIVIQSVALNKSQTKKINEQLKSLQNSSEEVVESLPEKTQK